MKGWHIDFVSVQSFPSVTFSVEALCAVPSGGILRAPELLFLRSRAFSVGLHSPFFLYTWSSSRATMKREERLEENTRGARKAYSIRSDERIPFSRLKEASSGYFRNAKSKRGCSPTLDIFSVDELLENNHSSNFSIFFHLHMNIHWIFPFLCSLESHTKSQGKEKLGNAEGQGGFSIVWFKPLWPSLAALFSSLEVFYDAHVSVDMLLARRSIEEYKTRKSESTRVSSSSGETAGSLDEDLLRPFARIAFRPLHGLHTI